MANKKMEEQRPLPENLCSDNNEFIRYQAISKETFDSYHNAAPNSDAAQLTEEKQTGENLSQYAVTISSIASAISTLTTYIPLTISFFTLVGFGYMTIQLVKLPHVLENYPHFIAATLTMIILTTIATYLLIWKHYQSNGKDSDSPKD